MWTSLNLRNRGLPANLARVETSAYDAWKNYHLAPYHGSVVPSRATCLTPGYERPLLWGESVPGNVPVYDTDGHHETLFYEPRFGPLAAGLEECVADPRLWPRDYPGTESASASTLSSTPVRSEKELFEAVADSSRRNVETGGDGIS